MKIGADDQDMAEQVIANINAAAPKKDRGVVRWMFGVLVLVVPVVMWAHVIWSLGAWAWRTAP